MTPRLTKGGVLATEATCQACGWADGKRGALGRAAQHHDKTGHEVVVETTTRVTYGDRAASLAAQGQERMDI